MFISRGYGSKNITALLKVSTRGKGFNSLLFIRKDIEPFEKKLFLG
jgi:hypothetical protein